MRRSAMADPLILAGRSLAGLALAMTASMSAAA